MRDFPTLEFQVKIPQSYFFNTLALYEKEVHEFIEQEFAKIEVEKIFLDSIQSLAHSIIKREVDSMKYHSLRDKGIWEDNIIKSLFKSELSDLEKDINDQIDRFQKYIVDPKMELIINAYKGK